MSETTFPGLARISSLTVKVLSDVLKCFVAGDVEEMLNTIISSRGKGFQMHQIVVRVNSNCEQRVAGFLYYISCWSSVGLTYSVSYQNCKCNEFM